MPDTTPHPIDVHVGARVRLGRRLRGLPQRLIAEVLGVSRQQVQKYERGANRISASVLVRISGRLKLPVARFFEGLPATQDQAPPSPQEQAVGAFLTLEEGPELARLLMSLPPRRRRQVVDVMRAFAEPPALEAAS